MIVKIIMHRGSGHRCIRPAAASFSSSSAASAAELLNLRLPARSSTIHLVDDMASKIGCHPTSSEAFAYPGPRSSYWRPIFELAFLTYDSGLAPKVSDYLRVAQGRELSWLTAFLLS